MTLDMMLEDKEAELVQSGHNSDELVEAVEFLGYNQEDALRPRAYRELGHGNYSNTSEAVNDVRKRLQDYLTRYRFLLEISQEQEGNITSALGEIAGNVPRHVAVSASPAFYVALYDSPTYLKLVVKDYAGDNQLLEHVRRAKSEFSAYNALDSDGVTDVMFDNYSEGSLHLGMGMLNSTADAVVYFVNEGQSTTVTAYFKKDAQQVVDQKRLAA